MMMSKKIRFANAVLLSSIITMLFIVAVTIQAEFSKSLKNDFLAGNFGHHWVGKGVLAATVFAVLTAVIYIFGKALAKEKYLVVLIKKLFFIILLGIIVFFLFFTWHFFAIG
jgi:hypothetical protein